MFDGWDAERRSGAEGSVASAARNFQPSGHFSETLGVIYQKGEIPFITSYPERGNNLVESLRYTDPVPGKAQGRVYINAAQYFDGVPPEVWAFHIGGYQVCQKWLKDRKGRALTLDEMEHYQKTIAALARTIELMEQIDATINEYGG